MQSSIKIILLIMVVLSSFVTLLFAHSIIDGGGHCLILSDDSVLTVGPSSTLTLKNLVLRNLSAERLVMGDADSKLILDNVKVCLDGNYTLTQGSLDFRNDVTFTGTQVFIFASDIGSIINASSKLTFDVGSTLSYAPTNAIRTLFAFQDGSSQLFLNGCTLCSSYTGMVLRRGTLLLGNKVVVSSSTNSTLSSCIAFGDSEFNVDLTTILLAGAQVEVTGLLDIK